MGCWRRNGEGNLLQCRSRATGPPRFGKKPVAHYRVKPSPQITSRLPEVRVGKSLNEDILDKVVGIGFVAVPAARGAAKKRNFVLYLLRELRRIGVRCRSCFGHSTDSTRRKRWSRRSPGALDNNPCELRPVLL